MDQPIIEQSADGHRPGATVSSVENKISSRISRNLQIFVMVFLFIPLYGVKRPKITLLISWFLLVLSLTFQVYHSAYDIQDSIRIYHKIPGINETIKRTEEIVRIEKTFLIAKECFAHAYFAVRGLVFFWFWISRNRIINILTDIVKVFDDDRTNKYMAESTACFVFSMINGIIIMAYVTLYNTVSHNFYWTYVASRIYSSVVILSILMVYHYVMSAYYCVLGKFFDKYKPPIDEKIMSTIKKITLIRINNIHLLIEKTFGFSIFWIFTLNYIEIVWNVIAVPRFDHFNMHDKDNFLWAIELFSCSMNLLTIIIIVMIIDSNRSKVGQLFINFEQSVIEHDQINNKSVQLLSKQIKDVTKLSFTAWFKFIPINKSTIFTYLVNLIVYSKSLFEIIRKIY